MKFYYIINARIPTEKAHGIQIMKMCEAFASAGSEVVLIVPKRRNTITTDPFAYYGVEQNFVIKYIPTVDLFGTYFPFAFLVGTVAFAFFVRLFLMREKEEVILYTRGEAPLFFSLLLPKRFKMFWETHIKPKKVRWFENILLKSRGLVVVTQYYKDELVMKHGIPAGKILCAPDGVDLDMFDIDVSKENARTQLSLPPSKHILVSTNSPVEWKGVPVLESIVDLLPDEFKTVFVGIEESASGISGISRVGKRPYSEMPVWLKAADALLLSGDPSSSIATHYTSPLKLFEYMASKRPIIAFDLPSFRDILNERNAFFIDPQNRESAMGDIVRYFKDEEMMEERAHNAFHDVKAYTWSHRAQNILSFIQDRV